MNNTYLRLPVVGHENIAYSCNVRVCTGPTVKMMSAIIMTQRFEGAAPSRERPSPALSAVRTEGLLRRKMTAIEALEVMSSESSERMTAIEALEVMSSEPSATTTETVTNVQTSAASVDNNKTTSVVVSSLACPLEVEAVPEENVAPPAAATSETSFMSWLQNTVGLDNDDIATMRRHKMKPSSLRKATKDDLREMGLVMGPIIDISSVQQDMPFQ